MVNDELLQFIRTQQSAGVADGDIKKALKELGGWDDGDIAEAYSRMGSPVTKSAAPSLPEQQPLSPRQAENQQMNPMGASPLGMSANVAPNLEPSPVTAPAEPISMQQKVSEISRSEEEPMKSAPVVDAMSAMPGQINHKPIGQPNMNIGSQETSPVGMNTASSNSVQATSNINAGRNLNMSMRGNDIGAGANNVAPAPAMPEVGNMSGSESQPQAPSNMASIQESMPAGDSMLRQAPPAPPVGMSNNVNSSPSMTTAPVMDMRSFGNGGVMQSSLDTKKRATKKQSSTWIWVLILLIGLAGLGYLAFAGGLLEQFGLMSKEADMQLDTEPVIDEQGAVVDLGPTALENSFAAAKVRTVGLSDLGIELEAGGNAATEFINYFTLAETTSTWRTNHPASTESAVQLDAAERALLSSMANSAEWRWSPESVWTSVMVSAPSTAAHFQTMLERGLATAINFSNDGQLDTGRILTENILAIGQQLTDSPTVTPWMFDLGLYIESRAIQNLITLYENDATPEQLTAMVSYQEEVTNLREVWLQWLEQASLLTSATRYLAGLHQSGASVIAPDIVNAVYASVGIDRAQAFSWIAVAQGSTDPMLVTSLLWPLTTLTHLISVPEESAAAAETLELVEQVADPMVQSHLAVYQAKTLAELLMTP